MATRGYSARIPDDLKQAVDQAVRDQTVHSFSEAVNAALEEWLGKAECATCATAAMAVREAQAELAGARSELARVSAELARLSGTPAGGGNRFADAVTKEQALAAYLAAATEAVPATPKGASVMSGYGNEHIWYVLPAMVRLGYLAKPAYGKYVPVPGMDIAEGVRETLKEVSAASMARKAAGAAKASSPPAASGRPAAAITAPSGAENAATEKAGSTPGAVSRPPVAARKEKAAAVAQIAREAGHDVRTASELAAVPVGAAMFQPPGGEKVVRGLAPEVPDHSGKPGLDDAPPGRPRGRARKRCEHRLPPGAWCKTCQQPK